MTSMICCGVSPKTLRSPPDSVHLPPAFDLSLTRTPRRGVTPMRAARSRIRSSSSVVSMTRIVCSPIFRE